MTEQSSPETEDKILTILQNCVDDPMWADHVEMPKRILRIVIERLRAQAAEALAIPPERHRTDEQRKDIQRAWDIVGFVAQDHQLNSTEGHLAVLRGIQLGRQLAAPIPDAAATPSDGAIYAAVSQRDMTPEERQMIEKAILDSTAQIYPLECVPAPAQARQELEAARSAAIALMGLNAAVDDYWNGGRTDEAVKLICYWQFKAKEALALAYPPPSTQAPAQPAPEPDK